MASAFPAAISNEPPPLDVSSEEEDSEDFRSHGLKLDVPSGEPTPVSTPYKTPRPVFKSSEVGNIDSATELQSTDDVVLRVLTLGHPGEMEIKQEALTLSEMNADSCGDLDIKESIKQDLDIEDDTDCKQITQIDENSLDMAIQEGSSTSASDSNAAEKICDIDTSEINCETTSENVQPSKGSDSTMESDKDDGAIDQFHDTVNINNTDSMVVEDSSGLNNTVDMEDEASNLETSTCFTTTESLVLSETPSHLCSVDKSVTEVELGVVSESEDDDFGAFQSIPTPIICPSQDDYTVPSDDDDFGEFAQVPSVPPETVINVKRPVQQLSVEDTDFADFNDYSSKYHNVPPFFASSVGSSDLSQVSSKMESVLKSLFVKEPAWTEENAEIPLRGIDSEISNSNDLVWIGIQDFEGSQGLMFKWPSSLTDKNLLSSLNIDRSTIVYHEKWGTIEVPRFATSLVQSPLQPQSCSYLDSQTKSKEHHRLTVANNNNNILDSITSQDHDKTPSMSTEAQEILRQLPDVSYMRAHTLVFPQRSPSEF